MPSPHLQEPSPLPQMNLSVTGCWHTSLVTQVYNFGFCNGFKREGQAVRYL